MKDGSTGAIPLSYNVFSDGYNWTMRRDEKGRIIYKSNGEPYWISEYWKKYIPEVAGDWNWAMPYEDPPNNPVYTHNWVHELMYTPVNLVLSGKDNSKINETKMRLRDTAAPFLNNITLKKNGDAISGSNQEVSMKSTDKLDIVLHFNENIRFANNDGTNNHGLKLRLSFVDKSNGTSDTDSWVDAELIDISGKTMTFRFDKQNCVSGKTLPDEFYLEGLSASEQSGWFSNTESFPLSLIDAGGRTVVTGESCYGIVTDLAGNPFEKFNVTRFGGGYRVSYDNLAPYVYKTTLWTSNFSEEEASGELNQNEIEPEKLYLKEGDQVNLKVIFSEEMSSDYDRLTDSSGTLLDTIATVNIVQNGSPLTLTRNSSPHANTPADSPFTYPITGGKNNSSKR